MSDIKLNQEQLAAVEGITSFVAAKNSKANSVRMTGPPGSGKTTTLVKALALSGVSNIVVTAPTNKATRQLRSMMDRDKITYETMTLHKSLGLRGVDITEKKFFSRNPSYESPLSNFQGGILVVDEYSMVNRQLLGYVEQDMDRYKLKTIYLGDDDQLPPVGELSSPVRDRVPDAYELTQIMRSDKDNPIQQTIACMRDQIRSGQYQPTALGSFYTEQGGGQYQFEGKDWLTYYLEAVKQGFANGDPDEARAICYTNNRVNALNQKARTAIFGKDVEQFVTGETLVIRAPVINENKEVILTTDEEVQVTEAFDNDEWEDDINGSGTYRVWSLTVKDELGHDHVIQVLHESAQATFDLELEKVRKACIKHKQTGKVSWRDNFYPMQEALAQVTYPYAITAHRSQGSTYKTVFADVHNVLSFVRGSDLNNRYGMQGTLSTEEYLRMLYVACSRSKFNLAVNHPYF